MFSSRVLVQVNSNMFDFYIHGHDPEDDALSNFNIDLREIIDALLASA